MKFTVDRKRWWRGHGGYESRLLRSDDDMRCCLGFLASACGYEDAHIREQADPMSITYRMGDHLWPQALLEPGGDGEWKHTDTCRSIIAVNDVKVDGSDSREYSWATEVAKVKTETDREEILRDLFSQVGVEVEFVG